MDNLTPDTRILDYNFSVAIRNSNNDVTIKKPQLFGETNF